MIPLSITTNLDEHPWVDCKDIPELALITRIGRLPQGTAAGKSTVCVLIEDKHGNRHMAQTTLALLTAAVGALNAADEASAEGVS